MRIEKSGCEIIVILKKCKDADPPDSHHASAMKPNTVTSEWKEHQKSRVESIVACVSNLSQNKKELRDSANCCCGGPQSMREDMENI